MLTMPLQIAVAAEKAGMAVPSDLDNFDEEQFPHFRVYCNAQLGVPITWGNHWRNAEIIAAIPLNKLKTVTFEDLEKAGFNP